MNSSAAPTTVRHRVVAACSLMAVLLYLDRFCISFAEIYIKEDFRLSDQQVGWMLSAFFWTYALGQVFAGWMGDRFGGRRMLTLFVLTWSLLTGLTGLATGFVWLMAMRFGFGAAQAGAYPTAANLITKWIPFYRRGFASSIVSMGGRVGGTLALLLTGYVIVFLVPPSVPSRFDVTDVLSPNRLCYELVYGERQPGQREGNGGVAELYGQRIRDRFSSELRRVVEQEAERYRRQHQVGSTAQPNGGQNPSESVAPDYLAALVSELNAVVREPGFFAASDLAGVTVEKEARRLLVRDVAALSDTQTQRLNRLILESLFRSSLRKVYGQGWRQMMLLYGAVGILVAAIIWWTIRDAPRQHPQVNEAEIALIEGRDLATPPPVSSPVGGIPFQQLIASGSMWLNGLMQFFTNIGWVFLVTTTPRYFADFHRIPVEDRSWMTSIPTMAAWIGMLAGGLVTDRLVLRLGRRWGRAAPIAATRFAAASAYLVCLFHPSPWFAVVAFSVSSLMCDLGVPAVWAYQQDVGGKYAGSVLGWGNMFGNIGAALGPLLIFWAIGDNQNWNRAFLTCGAAFALSGLAALGIDATKPVVREE